MICSSWALRQRSKDRKQRVRVESKVRFSWHTNWP